MSPYRKRIVFKAIGVFLAGCATLMVIPAFTNINDAVADNVKGVPTVPLGQLGASEWPEFMWLAPG